MRCLRRDFFWRRQVERDSAKKRSVLNVREGKKH